MRRKWTWERIVELLKILAFIAAVLVVGALVGPAPDGFVQGLATGMVLGR